MNRILLALAVAALALVGSAGAAAAHEGSGVLTVETADASGTGMRYVVRLVWENDGHPAADATLTATPIAPQGAAGTPVTLQPVDEDGRYQGTVAFPSAGDWTVRFTSVTPIATIERLEQIEPTTTTTSVTTTTTTPATTTTNSIPRTTSAPTTDVDGVASGPIDDDGGITGFVVAGALVALVFAVVIGFIRARRLRGQT